MSYRDIIGNTVDVGDTVVKLYKGYHGIAVAEDGKAKGLVVDFKENMTTTSAVVQPRGGGKTMNMRLDFCVRLPPELMYPEEPSE